MCVQPFFLRIIYLSRLFLNVIRFIVPIILIIRTSIDIYKQVINPKKDDGKKQIKDRIIAAIIVFLIPTIVNVILEKKKKTTNQDVYDEIGVCLEFANLEHIKEIESMRDSDYDKYLNDQQKVSLSRYEQRVAVIREKYNSSKNALVLGNSADSGNLIQCGSGSRYNTGLYNNIRTAGYKTREGVVAAAIYLSSQIDVHIPYFWSGGHFHGYHGYLSNGQYTSFEDTQDNFMGVPDSWGCQVKMDFGGTDKQRNGQTYPFGIDCSGFITWAIYNGGYYTGSSSQKLVVPTTSNVFNSLGGIRVSSVTLGDAKGKIKPGDLATKDGHVAMVVEVNNNSFKIAEEKGYDFGLVITELKYQNKSEGFEYIVLMDNFYSEYQKSSNLWNGFK